MPAFKKPKYSVEQTQEIMMRAFGALCDSEAPMSIDEIQQADLFLVSTTAQKMARVMNELVEKGVATTFEEVKADMEYRDKNDSSRAFAPLKAAEDSIPFDNTAITLDEAIDKICEIVRGKQ